jgi:DNA polymerase IIIc chi subunit
MQMTSTVLRKELHSLIDAMPDNFVQAILPLVNCFAEEYWKPVIEAADPEEIAMIDERMKDYEKDPLSFISLNDLLE